MSPNGNACVLFVPKQAVGANLVYFDMFNAAGSGCSLVIRSVLPVVSGAVAVSGLLGVDLFLTRTSAVGTGGTAATYNGTDPTACSINKKNPVGPVVNTLISARLTPTGGATAASVISQICVFTEETSSAAYMGKDNEMIDRYYNADPLIIPEGHGIRVVQGAVASVGNIGFDVAFDIVRNTN